MRTKKFLYNSIASAILQALTLLGGLILPRLYITTYGSEVNGLVSSIVQFVSYFSYVEAGLGVTLIYALFKPLAEKDIKQINSIISLAKNSYIKASVIYLILVIWLSIFYPFIINSESSDIITVILLVLVIGVFGALDFYTMAKYKVLLIADQREYVLSIVSIFAFIVNFALTVFMIKLNAYIVLVRTLPLVSFVLRSISLYFYVKYKYPFIRYDQPSGTIYLKHRWDALILQLSVSLNLSAPVVIISIFCSLKMVSVYSVYSMVFAGLIGIISIFSAGVSASFGNLVANKEFELLKKVHSQFEFSIYAITAFLYSCAFILINSFIRIYTQGVTDINYVSPVFEVLFVIWGILHNVRIPYTALVNAAGLYKETRKVNILQVVLLVFLSVILVQFFEITGVLIALIISALYRGIDLILVINRLVFKVLPNKAFLRIIRMFIVVIISYLPFWFWIKITASALCDWLIWAIVVSSWCCVITLLVNYLLDRSIFVDTIQRLKVFIPKGNFN